MCSGFNHLGIKKLPLRPHLKLVLSSKMSEVIEFNECYQAAVDLLYVINLAHAICLKCICLPL